MLSETVLLGIQISILGFAGMLPLMVNIFLWTHIITNHKRTLEAYYHGRKTK